MFERLEPSHAKIVIVGAGLAGLAAARVLLSHGINDLKILEAQYSAGGRLVTKKFDDGIIELGAQWAHASGSRMFDFAADCGLISSLESSEGSGIYFYPGGKRVSQLLVEEIRNVVQDILNRCIDFHHAENDTKVPSNVAEFMYSEFEKYLNCCNDKEVVQEIKKDLFDWNVRFEVIDNSCNTLSDLSARLWGQYGDDDFEQDHINITGGFSSLVDALTEHLPQRVLVTSCPVTSVRWKSQAGGEEGHPCEVVCEDGRTYSADHVIVTSSVGYLKNNLNMFEPPLPNNYQTAIKNLGFGTINKIFLFYDEVWWEELRGIQLVWGDKSLHDFITEEMGWVKSITGFDSVTTMENALLGWVGGDGAIECETLTEEDIALHCTLVLRHFTGLPSLPEPSLVVRSKWCSNKYVYGAYSHLSPGSESCNPHPQDTLLEPVSYTRNDGKSHCAVYFAGEALHKKYYSTAHGAFDCGEDQARKLLKHLKIPSS